ncbi:MAG: hypothetical protein J5642_04360 [Bacteroidales bacterium]|nr:hypothetical protein [Bacteroidales bacterium]
MKKITLLIIIVSCIFMQGCRPKESHSDPGNAIYYWRTTFTLNDYERSFLQKNHINKMYVRFFDVVDTWSYDDWDNVRPVGTLLFLDSVPQGIEIVPTVFITSEAIEQYNNFTEKLYDRIAAMAATNGISFKEIQIDCDWMESAQGKYYAFMEKFHQLLKEKGLRLSTTIRLAHTNCPPPSADYGVLMCYNTSPMENWETTNSILSTDDVKPYLRYLKSYALPLSVALPTYSWDLAFNKDKQMIYIDYEKSCLSGAHAVKELEKNKYEIISLENDWESSYGEYYKAHYVRHEEVSTATLMEVKDLVLKHLSQTPQHIVLYQLDSAQLSKYSDHDVEEIYR